MREKGSKELGEGAVVEVPTAQHVKPRLVSYWTPCMVLDKTTRSLAKLRHLRQALSEVTVITDIRTEGHINVRLKILRLITHNYKRGAIFYPALCQCMYVRVRDNNKKVQKSRGIQSKLL